MEAISAFTLCSYERLLSIGLEAGYEFISFSDIGQERGPYNCVLRHDIDSELMNCGRILDVERSLGIKSTYFLMVRSTAYNLFCIEARRMVERIIGDGHVIGLHFMGELCEDEGMGNITLEVLREKKWIEDEFGVTVPVFSFHQPSKAVLEAQIQIPGTLNTYNKKQMGQYFYVSDTNMHWRHEHPEEIFKYHLYPKLHLLIHPMWWTEHDMVVHQKWLNVLRENRDAVIDHWALRERSLEGIDLKSLKQNN